VPPGAAVAAAAAAGAGGAPPRRGPAAAAPAPAAATAGAGACTRRTGPRAPAECKRGGCRRVCCVGWGPKGPQSTLRASPTCPPHGHEEWHAATSHYTCCLQACHITLTPPPCTPPQAQPDSHSKSHSPNAARPTLASIRCDVLLSLLSIMSYMVLVSFSISLSLREGACVPHASNRLARVSCGAGAGERATHATQSSGGRADPSVVVPSPIDHLNSYPMHNQGGRAVGRALRDWAQRRPHVLKNTRSTQAQRATLALDQRLNNHMLCAVHCSHGARGR